MQDIQRDLDPQVENCCSVLASSQCLNRATNQQLRHLPSHLCFCWRQEGRLHLVKRPSIRGGRDMSPGREEWSRRTRHASEKAVSRSPQLLTPPYESPLHRNYGFGIDFFLQGEFSGIRGCPSSQMITEQIHQTWRDTCTTHVQMAARSPDFALWDRGEQ